jgi:hypothetical protein
MYFKEEDKDVDWIKVAHDRSEWWADMNFWVPLRRRIYDPAK